MYFDLFLSCVNTMTSRISTKPFFRFDWFEWFPGTTALSFKSPWNVKKSAQCAKGKAGWKVAWCSALTVATRIPRDGKWTVHVGMLTCWHVRMLTCWHVGTDISWQFYLFDNFTCLTIILFDNYSFWQLFSLTIIHVWQLYMSDNCTCLTIILFDNYTCLNYYPCVAIVKQFTGTWCTTRSARNVRNNTKRRATFVWGTGKY